jgi:ABC-type branched-subunit amino acid transport system substrate-binding protein
MRNFGRVLRSALAVWVSLAALAQGACTRPPRTLKIALVAPFEGRARQIGYDAFPAMRLALRDAIAAAPDDALQITFVAYDDGGEPAQAVRVARDVVRDPDVVAVIGHLTLTPTLAALHVYTEAGLAVLVPHLAPELLPRDGLVFRMAPARAALGNRGHDAPDPNTLPAAQQALARFAEISLGLPPTRGSVVAYAAASALIAAIRADQRTHGSPSRAGTAAALRTLRHDDCLLGPLNFDANGVWATAPVFP